VSGERMTLPPNLRSETHLIHRYGSLREPSLRQPQADSHELSEFTAGTLHQRSKTSYSYSTRLVTVPPLVFSATATSRLRWSQRPAKPRHPKFDFPTSGGASKTQTPKVRLPAIGWGSKTQTPKVRRRDLGWARVTPKPKVRFPDYE